MINLKSGTLRKADEGSATRRIDCHFRYTASQGVCAEGAEFQTDRFVSSGAAVERYEPRFTYNGFQYVVLKGLRTAPRKEDITGCVVHTAFPAIGSFSCSDETFNTLMRMGDGASRNHIMFGDFMAWAYQYLGGIQLPEKAGSCAAIPDVSATAFREVVIAPQFIDALTWVRVSVNGPCGEIVSVWRREGKIVTLDVTVPPNTTAVVRLPGETDRRVCSGTHSFSVAYDTKIRLTGTRTKE